MKIIFAISLMLACPLLAQAADPAPAPSAPEAAEKVSVDSIKEKYWARGNESELGVVQNRLYSKEKKLEVHLFYGLVSSDPFLSVTSLGGSVGYHFSEYLSLRALGWKASVGPSSALGAFQEWSGQPRANTNNPKGFAGLEGSASLLYGKLSLVGKAIIYFDLHVSAGTGFTMTESGNYPTGFIGIGQQIYLTKWASLRLDYRPMMYRERIVEKIVDIPGVLGSVRGTRTNWTHAVTLGIDFLIGGASEQ